jgi:hypothetical protein
MNAARRLARFRAALAAFVFMTVLVAFIAIPTIQEVANGGRPPRGDIIGALAILGFWWGAIVVMWVTEEKRLYVNRRKAGVQ